MSAVANYWQGDMHVVKYIGGVVIDWSSQLGSLWGLTTVSGHTTACVDRMA